MKTLKKILLFFVWTWYAWPIGKILKGLKWLALTCLGKGWLWGRRNPIVIELQKAARAGGVDPGRSGWRRTPNQSFDTWMIHHSHVVSKAQLKKIFRQIDPLLLKGDSDLDVDSYHFRMMAFEHNLFIRTPKKYRKLVLKILNKLDIFSGEKKLTVPYSIDKGEVYLNGSGEYARNLSC